MTKKQDIIDLYFMDARAKLIDIAAYLDRVDRHEGEIDFRQRAYLKAIDTMLHATENRTEAVLLSLSDTASHEPADSAAIPFAHGAPPESL